MNAIWLLTACLCSTPPSADAGQPLKLQVQMRDGSTVVLEVAQPNFQWVNIEGAKSQQRMIAWKDVRELKLVESPMGDQINRIESLLAQLSSPDYQAREQAEAELSDREQFGPLESHIRKTLPSVDLESEYRRRRILSSLESWSNPMENQFDELILADGIRLIGEAPGFSIEGNFFGRPLRLERNRIVRVAPTAGSRPVAGPQPFQIRTFNQPIPEFHGDDRESVVSFEKDRFGEAIQVEQDAAEMFAADGLLLNTEGAGRVMTIRYPFKFCPIDAGQKCVCPVDQSLGEPKRLNGTTLISFCLPGQPQVAAGVHRFGMFLERIEHSRDVIVEAINARGQIVGMVEATDQICVFAGFESNELITAIRVSRNPHLPELDRRIDATYALDCLTFDTPVPAIPSTGMGSPTQQRMIPARIELRDGNSLVASGMKLSDGDVSFVSPLIGQSIETSLADIRWIDFHRAADRSNRDRDGGDVMVQLLDQSIVRTSVEDWLQPTDFPEQRIGRGQVVGLWSGNQAARFGQTDAFQGNQPVIVWPGCQIEANGLEMRDDGYRWDADNSKKIVQQVRLRDEGDFEVETPDPDLTPQNDEVDFRSPEFTSTLWFSQPATADGDQGQVTLIDGQYFMIGGSSGFELKSLSSNTLEIQFGNSVKRYPLVRVAQIRFPSDSAR